MINGPMDQRTPPMTPQLALRVAIVGGCALVMFALIFFRLWFLQVLDTTHYDALAQTNVVRDIPIAAPRGVIVDSTGTPLATSQAVPAVLIAPESLPAPVSIQLKNYVHQPAKDYALYRKLDRLLKVSGKRISCKFTIYLNKPKSYDVRLAQIPCLVAQGVATSQYANVTIKSNVPTAVQDFIAERQADFPGVLSTDVFLRKYPLGENGAQVVGYIRQINQEELGTSKFKGIKLGSVVGQAGLEYEYNQYLQGTAGEEAVKVNSENQFEGYGSVSEPTQGATLKLWLNAKLEQVGQSALEQSIQINGGGGGAFVAMDPQNGAVYAMGSAPSFNPSIFTKPALSDSEYNSLTDTASNQPLINRATQGIGPDGSTFKVITALAALESGKWTPGEVYYDDGCYKADATATCQHNAGGNVYGSVDMVTAIQDSVDTFFYNLGGALNFDPLTHPSGGPLQDWARKFGIGKLTGIDLPGEGTGQVPSPNTFRALYQIQLDCEKHLGNYRHHTGSCDIADTPDWTIGDNVNMAVGQGDVQVTPLQLAVVYAAIANGGTIVTPHIGDAIESTSGQVLQNLDYPAKRKLPLNQAYLNIVRQGLRDAVTSGTSADVMGNFPEQVYGKTGTAQYGNAAQIKTNTEKDYAWYASYVPASATSKPIVVVVWVEKGGFGDIAAAPVAREIMSQWFFGNPGPYTAGTGKDL
jgi:penicillin-binding protein 2